MVRSVIRGDDVRDGRVQCRLLGLSINFDSTLAPPMELFLVQKILSSSQLIRFRDPRTIT